MIEASDGRVCRLVQHRSIDLRVVIGVVNDVCVGFCKVRGSGIWRAGPDVMYELSCGDQVGGGNTRTTSKVSSGKMLILLRVPRSGPS